MDNDRCAAWLVHVHFYCSTYCILPLNWERWRRGKSRGSYFSVWELIYSLSTRVVLSCWGNHSVNVFSYKEVHLALEKQSAHLSLPLKDAMEASRRRWIESKSAVVSLSSSPLSPSAIASLDCAFASGGQAHDRKRSERSHSLTEPCHVKRHTLSLPLWLLKYLYCILRVAVSVVVAQ